MFEDLCDGNLFKNHPLFSANPLALQIILFYDELEFCNPLGTHVKKHKLSIFLFTLGNIDPKCRSSLRVIHLLIQIQNQLLKKYGLDLILHPLIEDLNMIATQGITMLINGIERTFHGALLLCLGDNLGLNTLGGFKQSFSFAFRFCRTCYVTKSDYKSLSESSTVKLCSSEKHAQDCGFLSGPTEDHYSRTYGNNRRSILMDIPMYSMFHGGLPHDVMHGILEGIAPLQMALLLHHIILNRYLTLEEYNFRLKNFDYGYTETNRPQAIASRQILTEGKHLKISASQSLLLIRLLPLLIGDMVPTDDLNWKCFIILTKTVDIIMCPWSSVDLCAILKWNTMTNLSQFIQLMQLSQNSIFFYITLIKSFKLAAW